MPSPRHERREDALARAILDRYLGVRPGEAVTIETWSHALPWARALVVAARRRGARPSLLVEDEEAFFRSVEVVGSRFPQRFRSGSAGRGGAHIYLDGPEEFPRLLGLPPRDRERLLERHDRAWWTAARRARTRALRVAVGDATPTAAERYGVDRDAWQSELLRASLVDPDVLARRGEAVLRSLRGSPCFHLRHPNGTDLWVDVVPRAARTDVGRPEPARGFVWGHVPAGLLILPLRAHRTVGVWETNRPAYDRFARTPVAVGGRFVFRRGRLAELAFDRGGEPALPPPARFGPGTVRPIALTIGLNPAISFAPEFQELGEGTYGLLLGDAPYRPGGERPRRTFLGALAGAEIETDGSPVLAPESGAGRFHRP